MDKLGDLIRVLDNYKLRHIDVLNHQDSKSRYTQMYQQILKGKVKTDDEAARFLYGKEGHKNMPKYRTFKTEFKKRVLTSMIFIDASHQDFDGYQQAVYEINLEWTTIKAASRHGLYGVAASLAELLLETAQKHNYTEIVVQILDLLKISAARQADKKKFAVYQERSEYYNGLWLAEQKAKDYANLLKMEYVKTAEYKAHMSTTARVYFEELKPLLEKYDSVVLYLNAFIVEIYIYSTVNDYKNLLDVAERSLRYFSAKKFTLNVALSVFLEQRMVALMMLRRYAEAYDAINESLALRQKGTFNWFKGQESKVALCFRMCRYTEGYAVYKEVVAMPDFDKVLTGMSKEIWLIFNAYFHLLYKLGTAADLVLMEKTFDFQVLIKDMPTLNGDKRGMRLEILILEICFMMSKKQRDDLIDRIDALQKQFSRYTEKTDPSYRFNQFGNMLLEIPKSGFMRSLLEQNTAELLKDLQSVPYDMVESIYRSEVVELESLWGLMLDKYEGLR